MKECCKNKLEGILTLLQIKIDHYAGLEKSCERDKKRNIGNPNPDAMAKHLAVISYQKELNSIKEMIKIIIKEGI